MDYKVDTNEPKYIAMDEKNTLKHHVTRKREISMNVCFSF